MSATTPSRSTSDFRTGTSAWGNAWKIAAGLAVLGLAGTVAGYMADARHFAFSYLFAFEAFLSIALGSLFFVLIQHLTSAGWSVTVRRTSEFFMVGLPVFVLLFLPVYALRDTLYPWASHQTENTASAAVETEHGRAVAGDHRAGDGEPAMAHSLAVGAGNEGHSAMGQGHVMAGESSMGDEAEHERIEQDEHRELLHRKAPYLNLGFFTIRAVLYFAFWTFVALWLFRSSTRQDETKDPQITVRAARWAPVSLFAFAFTLTFAGFDWVMSLDPFWYSTIFGVWLFAGAFVGALAIITLVSLGLHRSGVLGESVNVEHFHDLGKLMFGFNIFWAYIGFAQFFLIWYASIPEETTFYHLRYDHASWRTVSLFLLATHFVLPFALLLSRNVKRRLALLGTGAAILLVTHIVEMYWIVLPNFRVATGEGSGGYSTVQFHWMDLACLLFVGSAYLATVFFQMTRHPLIPVGDPRLGRALHFENA